MWEGEEEVWSFMLGLPPQHEGVGGTSGTPLLPAHVSWHQSVLAVPLCFLEISGFQAIKILITGLKHLGDESKYVTFGLDLKDHSSTSRSDVKMNIIL